MLLAELIEHWRWGATALIFPLSKWGLKKRDEYISLIDSHKRLEAKMTRHIEDDKESSKQSNAKLDKIISTLGNVQMDTAANTALLNKQVSSHRDTK